MIERALALDEDPVAQRLALLDEPFDRALREVADQAIDRDAPALDHHPGLAGRHEHRRLAGRDGRLAQLECDRHLADRAVRRDRQDHALARAMAAADGGLHPLGRSSVVDDRGTPGGGGLRELRVVAEERVQAAEDVKAGVDRGQDGVPPLGRQLPAGRRDADQERVRRCRESQGIGQARDDRDVVAGQELVHVPAGLRGIQHGDHVVAPVADHSVRGLGMVVPELALGQDEEPSSVGRSHRPSVGKPAPRRRLRERALTAPLPAVACGPIGLDGRPCPLGVKRAGRRTMSGTCRICDEPATRAIGDYAFCDLHFERATRERRGGWQADVASIVLLVAFVVVLYAIDSLVQPQLSGTALIVIGLVIAIVPALVWLGFFYRRDRLEPEPRTMVFGIFVLGALVAHRDRHPPRRPALRCRQLAVRLAARPPGRGHPRRRVRPGRPEVPDAPAVGLRLARVR